MSAIFQEQLDHLLGIEGGYTNHKDDRGGATNFGVTEAVARAHGFKGDMKAYTLADASAVYQSDYWDAQKCDDIAALSPAVSSFMFETGVNCGVVQSGTFLQRCLNAFNNQGADYPDVATDGVIGPGTIAAMRALIAKRGKVGESVLLKALNCALGDFYIRISQTRPQNESFMVGWFTNRIHI